MNDKAILDGKKVVPGVDILTWARWIEENRDKKRVARDEIGTVIVSTVFLGLDHGFTGQRPLWFETMIFGGDHSDFQERYETYEQAEAGHKRAVEMVKNG